ncbi:cation diffusion facilitator family transporter [Methanocaldococcus sp.]
MREELKPIIFSIVGNIILSLLKIFVGYIYNSISLISDGIHSLSDVVTSVIGYFGIQLANKPPDEDHPYGHKRFESIVALIMGVILIFVSFEILKDAIFRLIGGKAIQVNSIMLLVVLISIIFKEVMTQYSLYVGKKLNNNILIADAYHHRSDVLSSIAVLIGLLLEKFGLALGDALAGIIVSLMILKVGFEITIENINYLSGRAPDREVIEKIKRLVLNNKKVLGVHDIKAHYVGPKIHVELHVEVPNNITAKELHDIETELKYKIEREIKEVESAYIHIDLVEK